MTSPSPDSISKSAGPARTWTREQIRSARQAALASLLQKRQMQLIPKEAGNFELAACPGLLLKESYWR